MIDEWFEEKIDRLCDWAPAYLNPRITRFCGTRFGWRMTLYADGFRRRVWGALSSIQWMEKKEPQEEETPAANPDDPALDRLDPALRRDIEAWNAEQAAWEEKQKKERAKWQSPRQRLTLWWAGRHEREKRRDERWARREQAAENRAQAHMHRMIPLMQAVQKSQFPAFLLMTLLSMLGVLSAGGGAVAYMAAACCAMWLAIAVETEYPPIARGVRQRYLAALGLRTLSSLLLLPMYFGGYVRQGVTSNVILQSAMVILLFAHAAFYLALVAFNRRQPLFLRMLSGVVGVIPALTASAAVALAATQLALPMPVPVFGAIGAAGALLAFGADRLIGVTDLGGIRLRYTPIWTGALLEASYFMMILGAWIA